MTDDRAKAVHQAIIRQNEQRRASIRPVEAEQEPLDLRQGRYARRSNSATWLQRLLLVASIAVLAHAGAAVPALARLDVAAFQTLFVQRPGLLGARHGSWLLQPAQRAEDALLDRLPWGWSWVRLPWMTHPLQVQW